MRQQSFPRVGKPLLSSSSHVSWRLGFTVQPCCRSKTLRGTSFLWIAISDLSLARWIHSSPLQAVNCTLRLRVVQKFTKAVTPWLILTHVSVTCLKFHRTSLD